MSDDPMAPAAPDIPAARAKKPSMKERLSTLFDTYGPVAIGVWLTLAVLTFASFYLAVRAGVDTTPVSDWAVANGCASQEAAERSGTAAVACVGLQASKPIRFFLTAFLVPIVARMRRTPASSDPASSDPAPSEPAPSEPTPS